MKGIAVRTISFAALLLATSWAAAAVPPSLEPPAGTVQIGRYPATGDQVYACATQTGGAPAWTLKAPEAWLSAPDGKRFAHHFAGPTWQATDGSTVTGKVVAKAAVPDAIPQLLLATTSSGAGALAGTRYVQRLDTTGGVAPTGACSVGAERRVPYTATYVFWR